MLCQHWHPVAPLLLELDTPDWQALINCPFSRVAQNSPDALVIKVKVESLGGLSNTMVRGKALCQLQKGTKHCSWTGCIGFTCTALALPALAIAPASICKLSCLAMLQVGKADVLLTEILAPASSQELLREEPLFTKVHSRPSKSLTGLLSQAACQH